MGWLKKLRGKGDERPPIPALIQAGAASGWGRLVDLTAKRARLVTLLEWEPGTDGAVEFELGARTFKLKARAMRGWADEDGYQRIELRFTDDRQSEALASALLELLARQG